MFEKLLPYDVAHTILSEYISYYRQFKRITKRAKIRFENRDWHGIQADAKARITMYRDMVGDTTTKILDLLGEKSEDNGIWREVRKMYFEEIVNFNTRNIAETFYNSVFRHSHKGLSVDEELMFVHSTGTYREFQSTIPIFHNFTFLPSIEETTGKIFKQFTFDAPFEDLERDQGYIADSLRKCLESYGINASDVRLELLKSIFFRNKGAYIVGRLLHPKAKPIPFVMPVLHDENGIYIDALLWNDGDLSSIFSYNRSYFLVEVDIVSEVVDFLKSILPTKNLGELYNSIGFEKHGKTFFYRDFLRHLKAHEGKFMMAPGIRGMVMSVFTLPEYNMVFKVIKDEFAPPKKVTEKEIKAKYELVNRHDRVGRMSDSYMFENLVVDRKRFTDEFLEELKGEIGSKLVITEETVEIKHLYIEKKMIPLNLFLEKCSMEEAEEVINEYGKAIKQMAAVNIFPGDMLLKNFGVTRLNRVVFYDYDEIGFLTEYNFRVIPEPRDEYEEMSGEPYYHIGPNDVFPEEFPRFLIGNPAIRAIFHRLHGNLYNVKFWRETQKRLLRGEIMDVFPYRRRRRFKKVYGGQ
ncbi:MAG: isocitrate dehydrogenase kinase/phosphatase [Saprospiraceae bacterium]|nr:MAG: isocitrate dehydrogenase kinase/phosphatase [Saprospiraceae bacterium]